MMLHFTKMHGLGNDFIVIDASTTPWTLRPEHIAALSQRDCGIGFDQCLIIERSDVPDVDFFYRIFNADGQEVGQCGNGARCIARFIQKKGLSTKTAWNIATRTTRMHLQVHPDESVSVTLSPPEFEPDRIPMRANVCAPDYTLDFPHQAPIKVHVINVGNPHALVCVENVDNVDVKTQGEKVSLHPCFPEQINAGFMQILTKDHVKLRVFERGCGETRACGSGAVAAVAVGRRFYHLDENVTVSLPGGDLMVTWPSPSITMPQPPITLRGPACFVYEGYLDLTKLPTAV